MQANVGTLSGQVVEFIEREIVEGTLVPGARLPSVVALATQFQVSRSAIRDALQALAARGLVITRQGSGTVVADSGPDAAAESLLLEARRAKVSADDAATALSDLWQGIVFLAAYAAAPDDLARLRSSVARLRAAVDEGSADRAQDAIAELQETLIGSASASPALALLLDPVISTLTRLTGRRRFRSLRSADAWASVVEALADRDAPAAGRSMRLITAESLSGS